MFYKFIVVVTFLLCQLSSNYISKMGEFCFKYTNNKPYLNGNQKKYEDMINVEIVEMQKDIKKKMKFILNLISQVLIFRCNILIYLSGFFFFFLPYIHYEFT